MVKSPARRSVKKSHARRSVKKSVVRRSVKKSAGRRSVKKSSVRVLFRMGSSSPMSPWVMVESPKRASSPKRSSPKRASSPKRSSPKQTSPKRFSPPRRVGLAGLTGGRTLTQEEIARILANRPSHLRRR